MGFDNYSVSVGAQPHYVLDLLPGTYTRHAMGYPGLQKIQFSRDERDFLNLWSYYLQIKTNNNNKNQENWNNYGDK